MKISMFTAAAAGLAFSAAAGAESDQRITSRLFDAAKIVQLQGRVGIQSTIAFGTEERIQNVAVGDSAAWQVTPNKRADLLFVKPTTPRARTNMTVVTDKNTYLFDLVSTPGVAPIYMLRFTYPASATQPVKKPPASADPPAVASTDAALSASLPNGRSETDPTALNFAWTAKGDKALVPSRSFDDGRNVYLSWKNGVTLPAILMRGPNGQEGPVNYAVKGDYVVIEGVPSELMLRLGKQKALLARTRATELAQASEEPRPRSRPRSAARKSPDLPWMANTP